MTTIYSPARVGFLLHIYCRPEPIPNRDAPVIEDTAAEFIQEGVITEDAEQPCGFSLTDRGKAWVRSICNTPIPRPAWVDGSGQIITG